MTGFILKKESQIMYDPTTCGILKKTKTYRNREQIGIYHRYRAAGKMN